MTCSAKALDQKYALVQYYMQQNQATEMGAPVSYGSNFARHIEVPVHSEAFAWSWLIRSKPLDQVAQKSTRTGLNCSQMYSSDDQSSHDIVSMFTGVTLLAVR